MANKLLYSWNVNGIRACAEKGLFGWLDSSGADLICLQETKAQTDQLSPEFLERPGYKSYWSSAVKKGYSGVVIYAKEEPAKVEKLGVPEFDDEGRFLALSLGNLVFVGCYFPNSQDAGARIDYKVAFCDAVMDWAAFQVRAGKDVVICGDYNIAHQPIDLARPKENEGNPGYLPQERAWMSKFLSQGWVDTFRHLHPQEQAFSWWSYRFKAKEKNIGWRIDYHCVSEGLKSRVKEAAIHPQILGSDHVPVSVLLS